MATTFWNCYTKAHNNVQVHPLEIAGCFLIESKVYTDDRGWFYESFREDRFKAAVGKEVHFLQDNTSCSRANVLRGLHFQKGVWAQAKLVHVAHGRVLDVVVDLRPDSPTHKTAVSIELKGGDGRMLFIPKGLAHGFLSLEDQTVFSYKCDAIYHPDSESGIRFNDPELAIDWGIPEADLILSEKDRKLPFLKDLEL